MNNKVNKYIVIHYVGAVSSAKANANYFYKENRKASAHYFIDEKEIYQVVEDKDAAWHTEGAKKYYNDCRNNNSIGIELCCKKDENGNWYFEKETIENGIRLVRSLINKYNVKIENVIRHYDVTRKVCPEPLIDEKDWNNFKRGIVLEEITNVSDALNYLEEKERITNKEYWKKAISTTRNVDFILIKWANDVMKILE